MIPLSQDVIDIIMETPEVLIMMQEDEVTKIYENRNRGVSAWNCLKTYANPQAIYRRKGESKYIAIAKESLSVDCDQKPIKISEEMN